MEESQTPPDQIPKSGDNLKQILIGIFLLSILVYVTFGLVSKKFGWDSPPKTAQEINPVQPANNSPVDTPASNPLIAKPTPVEPKPTTVDIAPAVKPAPVSRPSQKPKPKNVPQLGTNDNTIADSKKMESNEPVNTMAPASVTGKWKTNDGETWDITLESENVTIRVYDKKNKYQNLMTGTLSGREINLTSTKPGAKGQGALLISSDAKTMTGAIKFRVAHKDYVITRIEN